MKMSSVHHTTVGGTAARMVSNGERTKGIAMVGKLTSDVIDALRLASLPEILKRRRRMSQ